jgi:RNA recognition motif-containing protein
MKSTEKTAEKSLSIYVAGIPTKISKHELYSYFSYFGPISTVATFTNADTRHSVQNAACISPRARIKGYCIVTTASWTTYSKILSTEKHQLHGKQVVCARFQEGSKLMRLNRLNNQKRVIIKNAPPSLNLEDLKCFLSVSFGQVEIMYELKNGSTSPDSVHQEESTRQRKAYSVMFSEKSAAQRLVAQRLLNLSPSVQLQAERFKPHSKKQDVIASPGKPALAAPGPLPTTNGSLSLPEPHCEDIADLFRPTSKIYHTLRDARPSARRPEASFDSNLKFHRQPEGSARSPPRHLNLQPSSVNKSSRSGMTSTPQEALSSPLSVEGQ